MYAWVCMSVCVCAWRGLLRDTREGKSETNPISCSISFSHAGRVPFHGGPGWTPATLQPGVTPFTPESHTGEGGSTVNKSCAPAQNCTWNCYFEWNWSSPKVSSRLPLELFWLMIDAYFKYLDVLYVFILIRDQSSLKSLKIKSCSVNAIYKYSIKNVLMNTSSQYKLSGKYN